MTQKFPRFLLKQTLSSMNISKGSFKFVPSLDFAVKWTDQELYKFFDLTQEESQYIEGLIRPMEFASE